MRGRPLVRLVALDLLPSDDRSDADIDANVLYYRAVESRSLLAAPVTVAACVCGLSAAGVAMTTTPTLPSFSSFATLFPNTVPGFDQDLGVTVLSRQQRALPKTPINAGGFDFTPTLDEGISYDDNVLGYKGGPSSAISTNSASLGVNSNWSRDRLGAYVGVDNSTYLDTPKLSRTDVAAAVGGGLTLGRGEADLAYSHLSMHEDPTTIGSLPTSTPVPFSVDDVRADYKIPLGRVTISPNIDLSQWRYSDTTIGGQRVSQRYRDRDVAEGGAAMSVQTGEQWNVLAVLAGINSHYTHPQTGISAPNSTSYVAMGGFDYQITGPVRVRALAGLEGRYFQSSAYKQRTTPVGQFDVIWTPTGLTTLTGTLARSIEDPAQADVAGLTLTRAEFDVDHELRRDVVLRGKLGGDTVEYIGGPKNQYNVFAGVGATWSVNQTIQMVADYQFIWQSGAASTATPATTTGSPFPSGGFGRNILSLKVHVAL